MDFITSLPNSHGYTTILVVVDRLSKQAYFGALPRTYNAEKVVELFAEMGCKLYGLPWSTVSNGDAIFLSNFWHELFTLSGTLLHHSTAYHPQSDGQTEVVNLVLQQYLRCFTADYAKKWFKILHWAEYCYNISYHSSLAMTPFKAVYGRDPLSILDYVSLTTRTNFVDLVLTNQQELLNQLKLNLIKAQKNMKKTIDCRRRDEQFKVGDMAWANCNHTDNFL